MRGGVELVKRHLKKLRGRPVYLTLDIDVVDPAFAPGTGTPQVGGLSSAQILDLVRCLKGLKLVGCDLVEVRRPTITVRSLRCWRRICFSSCCVCFRGESQQQLQLALAVAMTPVQSLP